MIEITNCDYNKRYTYNGFYDEDKERADYKEYLNSLSNEELKRKDAMNDKRWGKIYER